MPRHAGSERPIVPIAKPIPDPLHLIALGANLPSEAGAPRATLEAALVGAAGARAGGGRRGAPGTARRRFRPDRGRTIVNGAAALASPLSPEAVLAALHEVERVLGRSRARRWGPRVCDLDLLASGDAVLPDAATVARLDRALGRAAHGDAARPSAAAPAAARARLRAAAARGRRRRLAAPAARAERCGRCWPRCRPTRSRGSSGSSPVQGSASASWIAVTASRSRPSSSSGWLLVCTVIIRSSASNQT